MTSSGRCAKCDREFRYKKFMTQQENGPLMMRIPAALFEAAIAAKNKVDQARVRGVSLNLTPAEIAPGREISENMDRPHPCECVGCGKLVCDACVVDARYCPFCGAGVKLMPSS